MHQLRSLAHTHAYAREHNTLEGKKREKTHANTGPRSNGQWKFMLPQIASQVGMQPRQVFGELRRSDYVFLCGVYVYCK
jgi:hypothetical protein